MQLMKALELDNDPANALRYSSQHIELLRDELGIVPPREFDVLVEEIRRIHTPDHTETPPLDPGPRHGVNGLDRLGHHPSWAPFPELAKARNRPRNVAAGWRHILLLGVGAILLLITGAVVGRIFVGTGQRFQEGRVIILPFENLTADSTHNGLGFLAADWIGQALQQTEIAEVVPLSYSRELAETASFESRAT